MTRFLENFIKALRDSGISISTAESIDAFNTLKIIGYQDRDNLKFALGSVLAKSFKDKEIFSRCFELYFSLLTLETASDSILKDLEKFQDELSALTRILIREDKMDIIRAVNEAGLAANITDMEFITQQGIFTRKIMEYLGFEELKRDIGWISEKKNLGGQQMGTALEKAKDQLYQYVNDYVKQHFLLYTALKTLQTAENHLKAARFSDIDINDMRKMQFLITKIAKRLNSRHSRRLKNQKKGGLDLRKTLRKNSPYQGCLFIPQYKDKKVDRPDFFVICDISRSVRNTAHFMLLFLYSLNKSLAKIRSFILCSNLVEVSHLFAKYPGEEALERIHRGEDLDIMLGPTDYGQAFMDFKEKYISAVNKKTTILILGDARNNEGDPQVEILREISEKCKKLIWLNPETRGIWTMGDSEMTRYLPYCHLAEECSTLNHLERVLDKLLQSSV